MKYLLPKHLSMKLMDLFKLKPKAYDIDKVINNSKQEILNYYNSPVYKDRLIQSGVIDEESLNQIIKLKTNNINNTEINYVYNPSNRSFGWTNINKQGFPIIFINTAKANTKDLAKEAIYHELGGHAASNSYSHSQDLLNFKHNNPEVFSDPIYERIYQNYNELMPQLKDSWKTLLSKGKNAFLKVASKEDIELFNNSNEEDIKNFIKYMTTEQEYAARALASNIGDWSGNPIDWNKQQLLQFFTPESINKLRNGVFGLIGTNLLIQTGDPDINNN